jgi:hypothetical protein
VWQPEIYWKLEDFDMQALGNLFGHFKFPPLSEASDANSSTFACGCSVYRKTNLK